MYVYIYIYIYVYDNLGNLSALLFVDSVILSARILSGFWQDSGIFIMRRILVIILPSICPDSSPPRYLLVNSYRENYSLRNSRKTSTKMTQTNVKVLAREIPYGHHEEDKPKLGHGMRRHEQVQP